MFGDGNKKENISLERDRERQRDSHWCRKNVFIWGQKQSGSDKAGSGAGGLIPPPVWISWPLPHSFQSYVRHTIISTHLKTTGTQTHSQTPTRIQNISYNSSSAVIGVCHLEQVFTILVKYRRSRLAGSGVKTPPEPPTWFCFRTGWTTGKTLEDDVAMKITERRKHNYDCL